jgi:hypothetical protein
MVPTRPQIESARAQFSAAVTAVAATARFSCKSISRIAAIAATSRVAHLSCRAALAASTCTVSSWKS